MRSSKFRARGRGVSRQFTRAQGRGRFEAQRDVFGDGEIGEQRGLLVNAGDAELAARRRA